MILAERSLLWWRTSEWEAVGVWATAVLTVFAVGFAVVQLRRAAKDRRETIRPFVQVDIEPSRFIAYLSIKNTGQTAASDVKIRFDTEPERTHKSNHSLTDASALKDGISILAPSREIRFFFDSFIERHESTLPSRYEGTVTYKTHGRNERYEERFILDLGVYMDSTVGDRKLHDLVDEIEKLRTEIGRWTESGHVRVLVQDRQRRAEREWLGIHRRKMKELQTTDGQVAMLKYFLSLRAKAIRDRFGLPE